MADRKQKRPKQPPNTLRRVLPAVLLIIFIAGLLGLVVKTSLSQSDKGSSINPLPTTTSEPGQVAYSMSDLIEQTRHFKGSPDAPVTILEFSDFQ